MLRRRDALAGECGRGEWPSRARSPRPARRARRDRSRAVHGPRTAGSKGVVHDGQWEGDGVCVGSGDEAIGRSADRGPRIRAKTTDREERTALLGPLFSARSFRLAPFGSLFSARSLAVRPIRAYALPPLPTAQSSTTSPLPSAPARPPTLADPARATPSRSTGRRADSATSRRRTDQPASRR